MQTVFIGIGAVGLVLLLVSLIAGDLLDGLFDAVGSDLVSGLSVSGFLAAFGFTGALVLAAGAPSWAAILAGLAAGAAVAAAAGFASSRLMRGGDESTVVSASLVGLPGTVIEDIPAQGYGVVNVVAAGHITRLNARASAPLRNGSAVVVTAVLSPTSVRVDPA